MGMADCKNCGYRILLAKIADIHVWKEDCDKYGTEICEAMNKPIDATPPEGTKTINVKITSKAIHSYGGREDND